MFNKKQKKAEKPEQPKVLPTKPVSEAIRELLGVYHAQVAKLQSDLGALALRDAKLDPKDGWRLHLDAGVFIQVPNE